MSDPVGLNLNISPDLRRALKMQAAGSDHSVRAVVVAALLQYFDTRWSDTSQTVRRVLAASPEWKKHIKEGKNP